MILAIFLIVVLLPVVKLVRGLRSTDVTPTESRHEDEEEGVR